MFQGPSPALSQRSPRATGGPLAKPGEVAEFLNKPVKTLTEWRYRGTGPRYHRVGRDVRYDWADVDAWLAEQARATA